MEVFDILLDNDGDLLFKQGDLLIDESTLQHQRDLLIAMPGEIRQHPLIGAGIRTELLNSISPDELRIAIQREMERDGMTVERLVIDGDNIQLQANYASA